MCQAQLRSAVTQILVTGATCRMVFAPPFTAQDPPFVMTVPRIKDVYRPVAALKIMLVIQMWATLLMSVMAIHAPINALLMEAGPMDRPAAGMKIAAPGFAPAELAETPTRMVTEFSMMSTARLWTTPNGNI